ncbi:hypothetical protein OG592_10690 [Streptomyces avidinii]|uniref:hypothetical protein n=1 Tax=Streptomyces avidinii TaxID=1895 RepID=UPI00386BCEBC|nr:hypothetical protein OG592_10690 [Streptomyces avidinii]
MTSAPRATIPRRRFARSRWALRHPVRLLRRYGFGWFQFAVLLVPVLLVIWVTVARADLPYPYPIR